MLDSTARKVDMRIEHYNKYLEEKFEIVIHKSDNEHIIQGYLIDRVSKQEYPIVNSILRLVDPSENYTKSFGYQWNKYKYSQLDSHSKLNLSYERFYTNTKWTPEELYNKRVLEVGSGAGRFTEILLKTGAHVVSFDYSTAVEANHQTHGHHKNLFLFQGDLYKIPFPDNYFDYVFCYGVLQHTPDPGLAFNCIFDKLKKFGKISIDYYLNPEHPTVWTTPKYFWRPLTTKIKPQILLAIIKIYIFFWLPFDTLLKKLPFGLGYRILARIPLPCYNYLSSGLTYKQRLEWAILDTFDALSANYDYPKTKREFEIMVSSVINSECEIFFGSNGLVANIIKS